MGDIELVIKIDEEVYKKAKETHDVMCDSVWLGIKYGTPLPKHHGRLIDADELKKHKYHDSDRFENAVAVAQIDWAPTIIEAEGSEE